MGLEFYIVNVVLRETILLDVAGILVGLPKLRRESDQQPGSGAMIEATNGCWQDLPSDVGATAEPSTRHQTRQKDR